jgi:hypothetical protein
MSRENRHEFHCGTLYKHPFTMRQISQNESQEYFSYTVFVTLNIVLTMLGFTEK